MLCSAFQTASAPFAYCASSMTMRAFKGCTGRLLGWPIMAAAAFNCASAAATGISITTQFTPSLHGGVVSEPLRRK